MRPKIQGGSQKNTPHIVFGNFETWTALIKIKNDPESRKLTLKQQKNQIAWNSIHGKSNNLTYNEYILAEEVKTSTMKRKNFWKIGLRFCGEHQIDKWNVIGANKAALR